MILDCLRNFTNKTFLEIMFYPLFFNNCHPTEGNDNLLNEAISYLSSAIKGALSGLRKFLATEMMKNAFCFNSKAFFVLKIFEFLSWLFGHVSKRLD